jgi:hypothetical protein
MLMHGYDHQISALTSKKDFWNASYAQGYQNALLFLLMKSRNNRSPRPPLFDFPLNIEFSSIAKVVKFPKDKIPRSIAAQTKRMLKRLPKEAKLIPDHTPFL